MALASLFNVPNNTGEMSYWSFAHMDHHRRVNAAILQDFGIALPEYVLDPVDMNNPGSFLELHQQMHNNTDAIIGVSGYDLSAVDWSDTKQRAGWIYLNAQLHVAEADAIGVF